MNLGKVTIVIPNYNQKQFISQAIQSALSQTMPADEIIVIDDGSTDGSSELVKDFGDRVRYIWQENKGLAGARNTGIRVAQGELIALLDADDEWLPSYLENMVALANQKPEASVYYCRARGIDVEGNELPQIFGGPPLLPEVLYNTLLRANFIIPSTILMRRSVVLGAGLFDQSLRSCEDWDLWLRLLPTHKIVGINDILVRYRIHGTSLSANLLGMQNAIRSVIEKQFGMDDGIPDGWTLEKRRAFGGMYRYHAISSVQRQSDWERGIIHLGKALVADPSLSDDLNTFYELILGTQPAGYRGTKLFVDPNENINRMFSELTKIMKLPQFTSLLKYKNRIFSSANYAAGLILYNLGERKLSRSYYFNALQMRPGLWRDHLLVENFFKSFLSEKMLTMLKKYKDSKVTYPEVIAGGESNH